MFYSIKAKIALEDETQNLRRLQKYRTCAWNNFPNKCSNRTFGKKTNRVNEAKLYRNKLAEMCKDSNNVAVC